MAIDSEQVNGGTSCIGAGCLRAALTRGQFADSVEMSRALHHFALPCGVCWGQLTALTVEEIELDVLIRHATEADEPPLALALGRLALISRHPDLAVALSPTHRYLLEAAWENSFELCWLLIEEARHLAMGSPDRSGGRIERWQVIEDALTSHSCEAYLDLQLLIRAYRADDIRIHGTGGLFTAGAILKEILGQADRCRSEIQATIYELIADLHRVCIREFSKSLDFLARAEAALQGVRMPGRLAETRFRIGLSRLAQKDFEPAFAAFTEALKLIPEAMDPRLRCEILLHMGGIKIQVNCLDQIRPLMEEAEPFFEPHASDLMRAQRKWLWSHVYLDEGKFERSEKLFIEALIGLQDFGGSNLEAMANLIEFYLRSRNLPKFKRVAAHFLKALREPSPAFVREIHQLFDGDKPTLREIQIFARKWTEGDNQA